MAWMSVGFPGLKCCPSLPLHTLTSQADSDCCAWHGSQVCVCVCVCYAVVSTFNCVCLFEVELQSVFIC